MFTVIWTNTPTIKQEDSYTTLMLTLKEKKKIWILFTRMKKKKKSAQNTLILAFSNIFDNINLRYIHCHNGRHWDFKKKGKKKKTLSQLYLIQFNSSITISTSHLPFSHVLIIKGKPFSLSVCHYYISVLLIELHETLSIKCCHQMA